jgi:hypothetical protein
MLLASPAWAVGDAVLWYEGNGGYGTSMASVVSSALYGAGASSISDTTTWPSSLDTYRVLFLVLSTTSYTSAQLAQIDAFVDSGGIVVFLADNSGYSSVPGTVFNAVASYMGLSTRFVASTYDGGCYFWGTAMATHPLTSGVSSLAYACTSHVTPGSGATSLYRGSSSQIFAVYEGGAVFVADVNVFDTGCSLPSANGVFAANIFNFACASSGRYYRDADADGYGNPSEYVTACSRPTGYVTDATDCDDSRASVHPGATETWYDGLDQDCSGGSDYDQDLDGHDWTRFGGGDCDDLDATVHPGARESGDGVDEDCDGVVDEGTSVHDDDGDGFAEAGGDCDDAAADAHPGAPELPDGRDNDCDGVIDEGTERYDDDGDGFTEAAGDCDDSNPRVRPGAVEIDDNGIDDDCDGVVDDGAFDADGDGVTADGGDCDDEDASTRPGAPELPDGRDNDCDGVIDEGTERGDDDGDGFSEAEGDCDDSLARTNPDAAEIPGNGRDDDCDGLVDEGSDWYDDDGDGFAEEAGDCDDSSSAVSPGAVETPGNGIDDDCDGLVDEGSALTDGDGDGWGVDEGDCDDRDGWRNPGATEFCDGLDNNCDGSIDEGCEAVDTGVGLDGKPGDCGCASRGRPGPRSLGMLAGLLALLGLRRRRP